MAELVAGVVSGTRTGAARGGPPAAGHVVAQTVKRRLTAERGKTMSAVGKKTPADFALCALFQLDYVRMTMCVLLWHLACFACTSVHSPGRIDPDYVQVAEVVTLGVHQTAAGTALGPQSVRREAVSSLHVQMFLHRGRQSWWETSRDGNGHKHPLASEGTKTHHVFICSKMKCLFCFLGLRRRVPTPTNSISAVVFDSREQHKA